MPELKTAVEMFNELARRGLVTPAPDELGLAMPTLMRSVPTITTYGTADVPEPKGTPLDARLETRS